MDKKILRALVTWLRKKRPGTFVKLRDFILEYVSLMGVVPMSAQLSARVIRRDGTIEDKGVICSHEVTDNFVAALVDTLQGAVADFSTYKYHDSGISAQAEAQTDSALISACGEAKTTGTQIEGATGNIYKSVATHTFAGVFAITEHGLFSGADILMDRSVFTAINVAVGDKIEYTYQLTCTAGG